MAEWIDRYYDPSLDITEYEHPLVEKCLKEKRKLEEVSLEDADWFLLYHVSPERKNSLLWYPFDKKDRVLEIGAGSGSLTGMLCDKVAAVDSFDISLKLSRWNQLRNEEKENLRIFPGSPFEAAEQGGYDYVVVQDDLKNAASYFQGEHACQTYLREVKKFLKPTGHLLLLTGNRLALKYLAGEPDACSGRYFEGIEHYPHTKRQRECSGGELKNLLEESGFFISCWYYPYPNQLLPNEIFVEETMERYGYGKKYNHFVPGTLELFREDILTKDLLQEGTIKTYANGFLIDATVQLCKEKNEILYVKINSDRKEEFQIITRIKEKAGICCVQKEALCEKARPHLEKMFAYEKARQTGKFICQLGEKTKNGIFYPFLSGKNLDESVDEEIKSGNLEKYFCCLKQAVEETAEESAVFGEECYDETFQEYFGSKKLSGTMECVRPANIDLIPANIFRVKEKFVTIDNEWVLDVWVPKKFILWRMVNELVYGHPTIEEVMDREALYDFFAITKEEAVVFDEWNHHFVEEYVGANFLRQYAVLPQKVKLEQDLEYKMGFSSVLYLDYGEGFTEEHTCKSYQTLEKGCFRVSYEISQPQNVRAIRWDPLEGRFCCCQVAVKLQDNQTGRVQPINSCASYDGMDFFATTDPQYRIERDWIEQGRLTLEGKLQYLSDEQVERYFLTPKNIWEKLGRKLETRKQKRQTKGIKE